MTQDILILLAWTAISTVGFFLYLRDMLKGKTKPHMFTWLIWAIMGYIGFGIQVAYDAGIASLVMLWFSIVPTFVFFYTLKSSQKDIALVDYFSLAGAFIALSFWLFLDMAFISVLLLLTIDYLAYFPTFRKCYKKPFEETVILFVLVNFWYIASIITLDNLVFENYGYPLWLFIINTIFVSFVLIRRHQLKKIII